MIRILNSDKLDYEIFQRYKKNSLCSDRDHIDMFIIIIQIGLKMPINRYLH